MSRTPRLLNLVLAMAALLLAPTAQAAPKAFPEPAPFPIAWEFEFIHGKPLPIAVKGEDGLYHWYWFMPYKVVNRTGDDRLFIPDVTVVTDKGDVIVANNHIPANVYVAVKKRLGNNLLLNPSQAVGPLLQGEDFARESVIVWPDPAHDIDHLDVMIAGLSGEWISFDPTKPDPADSVDSTTSPTGRPVAAAASATPATAEAPAGEEAATAPATQPASAPVKVVAKPAAPAPKLAGQARIFRKTRMISYDLPGTGAPPQDTVMITKGDTWIMR